MTTPTSPAVSQQAAVDAALLVLKSMGLSLDDLTGASSNRPPVPTFAEYVPVVSATVTDGTRKAYGSYWNRIVGQWGTRRLDEPTPSEIKQLAAYVKANAVQRRNSRGGHNAAENLISALRCLYNRAVDDGLIAEQGNPARKVLPVSVAATTGTYSAKVGTAGRFEEPALSRSSRDRPIDFRTSSAASTAACWDVVGESGVVVTVVLHARAGTGRGRGWPRAPRRESRR